MEANLEVKKENFKIKLDFKVIKSAMPDEMYKVFHWYKNDEWEKFLGATTQWDLDTYLDCLP